MPNPWICDEALDKLDRKLNPLFSRLSRPAGEDICSLGFYDDHRPQIAFRSAAGIVAFQQGMASFLGNPSSDKGVKLARWLRRHPPVLAVHPKFQALHH